MTQTGIRSPGLRSATDPATFAIIRNSLLKATEEMKIVLAKTAFSPILKVAGDYSCGIFDAQGRMVAQGPDLPVHLGSMPHAVIAVAEAFSGDIHDGDVFIHNDPFQGGSHLPDVNVVTPAFHGDLLLGFACLRAHWPDVGGDTPGSYGTVTSIFGEGLRLPPVRLYAAGKPLRDIHAIITANVRTPDERLGDLAAQVAANRRACTRLSALAKRYGPQTIVAVMSDILDYSEHLMALRLAQMPDGVSEFHDRLDGDGILENGQTTDEPIDIHMRIEKSGTRIKVDFAGSSSAVAGPINSPLAVTASGVYCAIKMIVDPNSLIPANSGAWRLIEVVAPKGSVVNAEYPSPVVYANTEMSHRVCDMVFGAAAQIWPENVMACSQGTSGVVTFGGNNPSTGKAYVSYEVVKGGMGGRRGKDGINAICAGISNTMNTPVEIVEMSFPLRLNCYEIVTDSGGPGQFRGGLGVRRSWQVLDATCRATVCFERTVMPPFGVCGGSSAPPARVMLVDPDGREFVLNSKQSEIVQPGWSIEVVAPGGGGYGPVSARATAAIQRDIDEGYVTVEAAEALYGRTENE
jgi:N-methylhydantoinase B